MSKTCEFCKCKVEDGMAVVCGWCERGICQMCSRGGLCGRCAGYTLPEAVDLDEGA